MVVRSLANSYEAKVNCRTFATCKHIVRDNLVPILLGLLWHSGENLSQSTVEKIWASAVWSLSQRRVEFSKQWRGKSRDCHKSAKSSAAHAALHQLGEMMIMIETFHKRWLSDINSQLETFWHTQILKIWLGIQFCLAIIWTKMWNSRFLQPPCHGKGE